MVSYGEKCNSELLDYYGFVLPAGNNINDCVHVELELNKDDPLFNEKQIMYRAHKPE